ncbi:MAG TPA: FG-GAP repeat protein, partial [Solirubrobacteraceae bacterium]
MLALLAVSAMVVVGVIMVGAGVPGAGVASRSAVGGASALARLESLPLQAQSVISSSLGSATAGFDARHSGAGYRMHGGGVAAWFGAHGAVLGAGASPLRIASVAVGRGGDLHPLGIVSVKAHANRIVYDRDAVSEWYSAGPLGIEQGFTLARRPAGARRSLTIALGLAGALRVRRSGSGLLFLTRSGRRALRYGGLTATDARGRRVPATLSARDGRLLLRIVDAHAVYPLRIDPLIQPGLKLTPTDEDGDAYFGWDVALSADGSTALIGGNFDDSYAGAAWVFTGSGSSWTEQAKLTAPTTGPDAEIGEGFFGQSVALSS